MKIVVIDGKGGKMGAQLIEQLKAQKFAAKAELLAIGTNGIATAAMLRAGAHAGATGENPVVVACRNASYIVGPLGILAADSLLGEVTPAMALAVGQSTAAKILLPINRCNHYVVGVQELPLATLVQMAVEKMAELEAGN